MTGDDDEYMAVKNFETQWDDKAVSEAGYYRQEVRRNNFIQLFLDRYNADQYVATHLYGAINNMSVVDVPQE